MLTFLHRGNREAIQRVANFSNYAIKWLKRLLSTLENYHDLQTANLVKFALFTGLRGGEIFNLK